MTNAKWLTHQYKFGACSVENNYRYYRYYLLARVLELFKIDGLPENINETWIKNNLILNGVVCFTNKLPNAHGKLYGMNCGLSGVGNEYQATTATIANANLGSGQYEISKDCVCVYLTKADYYFPQGIQTQLENTANLLADNAVSLNVAQINTRVHSFVSVDNYAQKQTAEQALQSMYSGKPYTVLTSDMLTKIQVNPMSSASTNTDISELITLRQYILASFWQDLGVNLNAVNKKERLISDEINSAKGYEEFSFNTIIDNLQYWFDKVNAMYNTSITVKANAVIERGFESDVQLSDVRDIDENVQDSVQE